MSVDTLRENFHINRVRIQNLGDFLTAQTYRHEITSAYEKISLLNWEPLQSLCDRGIRQGKSPSYNDYSGLLCLKPRHTRELLIDKTCYDFIDIATKESIKKQLVIDGDILITRSGAGTIGRASIYYGDDEVYTNDHLFIIRISRGDSGYICAFIKSYWGKRILEAGVSGSTGQLNLSNAYIKKIPIYTPESEIQKYIGNKVRQAETLRAWAKNLDTKISNYYNDLFSGIPTIKPEYHHSIISVDDLLPRLNAEFYSNHYRQVERGLNEKFDTLITIKDIAPVSKIKSKPEKDCTYFEISNVCTSSGKFLSGTFYQKGTAPNNAQRRFDVGDIAVSTRRPNRGAVAVVEDNNPNNYYSVFLARLKPKNLTISYWLKEYLRHDVGKLLLLKRCTWTTYPVISEDDLQTIPVPMLKDDWEKVGAWSQIKNDLQMLSTFLVNAAKQLVEAIIENKLTEQELINAQQALERGDTTLDRKILSRLTTKGIDDEGSPPLFPDLDQLYKLLEKAEEPLEVTP